MWGAGKWRRSSGADRAAPGDRVAREDGPGYAYEDEDQSPVFALRPGMKVRHRQFGVGSVISVELRFGFMEEPNVPELLCAAALEGEQVDLNRTTFFLSRETIVPNKSVSMVRWRQWLFALMSRNAQSASSFYRIPANRVVELGMQVEL